MAITTQLVGALGSKGYLVATTKPVTYALPPNPQGWSIMIAKFTNKDNLSFKCVNRKTGATVWESDSPSAWFSSMNPTPELAEATRVGINIEIRNNVAAIVCIASGIDNQPPTA